MLNGLIQPHNPSSYFLIYVRKQVVLRQNCDFQTENVSPEVHIPRAMHALGHQSPHGLLVRVMLGQVHL